MIGRLKALRNKKGFTLVELMIVVAVIGILAIVLLPKIGTLKTTAKQAGLDTNMRMVEAVVQSQISDYVGKGTASAADISSRNGTAENTLQTSIANALSGGPANNRDNNQALKDPFNSWSGANVPTAALTAFPGSTAAVVDVTSSPAGNNPSFSPFLPGAGGANAVGVLYVEIYPSGGNGSDIWVTITPYDNAGNALLNKQVTIKP